MCTPQGWGPAGGMQQRLTPVKGTRALGWPFLKVSLLPSQRVTQASFSLNKARGEDAGSVSPGRSNLHCSSPRGSVEVYIGGDCYEKCFVPTPLRLLLLFFSVPGKLGRA